MNQASLSELIRSEEAKRRRCADAVQQWKAFLETCAWVGLQQPIPRNSKAGCLRQETIRRQRQNSA
jgi:hypothetical protein